MASAADLVERLVALNVAPLEERFKGRERSLDARVPLPLALRLDGVGFGKALKGFRPRDARVHSALVEGAVELVKRFSASGAYVASDEVNVLLLGPSLPYGGRVQKLVSVSASILSAVVSTLLNRRLYFDSRVIPLAGVDDAKEYVLYRARIALNNYVGGTLHRLGSPPPPGAGLSRQIEQLAEVGVILEERPMWEWGGTSVVWLLESGKRVAGTREGPLPLIEALESYRAPEVGEP